MNASIFAGDIADAQADALCTSTNPRLSLMMGTGASVRERGGPEVARACEAIIVAHGHLPAGSAHVTTAGALPHKMIIHCVASDTTHRSSTGIVRMCVRNAIDLAAEGGCTSIALPVLGTGHARLPFAETLGAIAEELRGAPLERVVFVMNDPDRANPARTVIRRILGGNVEIVKSTRVEPEAPSFWDDL
jgi:O-acetyl-ADP-ribose deacetylase (regulator of RNase III)